MKKTISILLTLLIVASLTACGNNQSQNNETNTQEEFIAWHNSTPDEFIEKFGKTFNLEDIENVTYQYNIEVDMAEASYYVEIENSDTVDETTTPDDAETTETEIDSTSYKVVVRMKKMYEWHNILSDFGEQMENTTQNNISDKIKGKITSGEDPFGKYVAGVWFDEELQIVYAMIIYNENGDLSVAKDIFVPNAT